MKTIIAAFRDQAAADQAIAFLHDKGVDDVELMQRDGGVKRSIDHLHDLDVPDDRARLYAEIMERGAPVVAAHTERDADALAQELDRLGSIDLDAGTTMETTEREREREERMEAREPIEERETAGRDLDVVEERVVVGTREVPRGAVRVRTFVVEHPVREDVKLTEERIDVSREPVNERISPSAAEAASLGEQEFVVTATGEEAVVAKEARVVERVHIGTTPETRTETVEEVERRRDVEVEPIRSDEKPTDRRR